MYKYLGQFKYRTVNSRLKTRPFIKLEEENPVRSAFMNFMREHDKTKCVYDCNPYFEVYRLRDNLYGLYSDSLGGVADQWVFVLLGPQKAMVIDTAYGLGNFRALVEELTEGRPYYVVNTHGHPDHCGGNSHFDRVYCHQYEVDAIRRLEATSDKFTSIVNDEGTDGRYTHFDPADLPPARDYELVGVESGHIFNLGGGFEVELIFMPGHTAGHCVLLDKRDRILFGGDDMCIGVLHIGFAATDDPYSRYATVTGLRDELEKLCRRLNEFDSIFPAHGIVGIGSLWLQDVLETCREVTENPEDYDKVIPVFNSDKLRYAKRIHDSGYLTYEAGNV